MFAEADKGPSRLSEAPALGELLVKRNLLTPEQLATALDEQRRTGRRLGDVIVELGFTTSVVVAQALATQHGGLFKSEYGTALGFETGAEPGPAEPPPVTDAVGSSQGPARRSNRVGLRLVPTGTRAPAQLEPEPRDAQEQPQLPAETAATERLASLQAELAFVRSERDLLAADIAEAEAARDAADASRAWVAAERNAAIADAAALAARVETLEQQLERRPDETPEPAPPAAEPEPADRHLVFLGLPIGYKLLELPGPVPAAGSVVTLPDGAGGSSSQLVVRVGPAPFPGSALRCAYLLPV